MEYAQLNESKTEAIQITTHGNVEWDATHFCPASALTPDEAAQFRVVPLTATDPPAIDPITQTVMRNGCEMVGGAWQYRWDVADRFATKAEKDAAIAAAASAVKTSLVKQIDEAVLAIYDRPMALSKEYEAREKAAADYKSAGYAGTVPARLAGFATPAGMTPTAAADLVLSQAAQMRGALDSLGDLRMRKYEVQRATTEAAARTAHAAIMAQVAAIASALG